jgi:hypothetical protein
MIRLLNEAFVEANIPVEKRIYNAFYCLIFYRTWRYHCRFSPDMKMENFVSNESYQALELNAWNLLKLVFICREIGPEYFQPQLGLSQTCEKCFSIIRSFTATFNTVVNFSALELLERVHKVQLQEEIINFLKEDFIFRQNLIRSAKFKDALLEEMPTDEKLEFVISLAKEDALNSAKMIGIIINGHEQAAANYFSCLKDYSTVQQHKSLKSEEGSSKINCSSGIFEYQGITFKNESTGKILLIFIYYNQASILIIFSRWKLFQNHR